MKTDETNGNSKADLEELIARGGACLGTTIVLLITALHYKTSTFYWTSFMILGLVTIVYVVIIVTEIHSKNKNKTGTK